MNAKDKGVWIDERQAWIVYVKKDRIELKVVESEVEAYHLHGGSGSSTPYGPQDAVSEPALNRRKAQQLKKFYNLLIDELDPVERLYIAGPAEAKVGLEKELLSMKSLNLGTLEVEPADSMTENQFKAQVKKFFESLEK